MSVERVRGRLSKDTRKARARVKICVFIRSLKIPGRLFPGDVIYLAPHGPPDSRRAGGGLGLRSCGRSWGGLCPVVGIRDGPRWCCEIC
jgi:hypothetical protein